MHGHDKDRPQPHLHVLATGRPVAADGTVDRSAPLWRNRDEVKAERARTARLVNEHCHTVAAFHPGGFKDIGREEDTPKWRTPTGVYLKVVAAEAVGAGWEEKDAAARAQYAAARRSAELAEPKRTRKKEIAAAEARGEEPPRVRPTLRQRLALAEAGRSELAADLDRLAAERARLTGEKRDAAELVGKAEVRVGEERARADRAEGLVAHARLSAERMAAEKQQDEAARAAERQALEQRAGDAEGRVRELEARQVQPLALTEKQRPMLEDVCARNGIKGDIGNDAQAQLRAFAALHAEEDARDERKRREAGAKAQAAKAEIEEIARERDEAVQQAAAAEASPELVERAEQAEAERDALATGLGLTPEQVAQAARRAEGGLAKAERQAREEAAAALQPHCMPIWRTHLATSKRLADAVFDEGAEAAEALVRDPDRAGTVLANPDLSGVEELVAAIREADASRPRRTLTLQERTERSESAAAAEAERARAAELERDRAQEAGRDARGKLSEMEAALWDVTRQRNDARAALESAGVEVQAAEEAARKQRIAKAQAEEEAHRRAVAAADAKAERQRRLDARRSHWTRERQAREKYAGRMAEWEAGRWTSEAGMVDSLKRAFKQENDLQQSLERGGTDSQARRYWAEAVAMQDVLVEFAGKRGVDFGHGRPEPAWRIERAAFLNHGRTMAQDENSDRVHVAFPRVAGAPELVYDRERRRWNYKHPDPEHSYWTEKAEGWESAAGIMHHASVRDALKRGDSVPDKVLADYPALAPKPQQDKPKTPPAPEKEQQKALKKPPPSRGRGGDMEM